MKTKHTLAALALLLTGIAACWQLWPTHFTEAVDAGGERPHTAESAPAPSAPRLLALPKVAAYRPATPLRQYVVQMHDDFRPNGNDSSAVGTLLAFEGKLTVGEIERADAITWTYFKLSALSFTSEGKQGTELPEPVRKLLVRELAQGYFTGRDARGQIVAYRFSRPLSSLSQGLLRQLAVTTQLVTPGDITLPSRWAVHEIDTAGEASVAYASTGEASWRKTKTAYTKLITDAGLVADPGEVATRKIQGAGTLTLRDGHLEQASLKEHTSMLFGAAVMEDYVEVQIARKPGRPSTDVHALRRLLHGLPTVSAFTLPVVQQRPVEESLREELGNATFEDLTHAMEELATDDEAGRRALLQKFEADLKLNPAHATRLAERMATAEVREQSMIVSALSNAQTHDATASLRAISEDPELEDGVRETATALLGFTTQADEETRERLERASNDAEDPQSGTATLALGNLADSMWEDDPEASEEIVGELLERLKAATDENAQRQLIAALGNSGDPRLVEALAPWMASESAPLRAAAYGALRLIGSEPALATMARGSLGDDNPRVRAEVMAALAARPMPGTLQIAVTCLQQDPIAEVRLEAVSVLGMLPLSNTGLALERVAERDADADVRAAALGLLRRHQQPG